MSISTWSEAFWIWGLYKGHRLEKTHRGYKRPQAPLNQKGRPLFWVFSLCLDDFWAFLLSSKHKKHIKVSWFFLLHQKYKVLFLYPIFFSLVLHLGFRVYGCECSFLATIHTPNLLNLFLVFILLFYALIIWFITFFSMSLALFVSLA